MSGSMIPWCTFTFNPLSGCRHGCEYCYARKLVHRFSGDVRENKLHRERYRIENGIYVLDEPFDGPDGKRITAPFGFEPTYHRYRLHDLDKRKGGYNIFVGSLADLFGEWVPDYMLEEIFGVLRNPYINYLFLTKNPQRYREILEAGWLPSGDNYWYGTTITSNRDAEERLGAMTALEAEGCKTLISVEPLQERLAPELVKDICFSDWVILGAETGNRKEKPRVETRWVTDFLDVDPDVRAPVFMQKSLRDAAPEFLMEYPEILAENVEKTKLRSYADKNFGNCILCGEHGRKSEMVTLTARAGRGTKSLVMGFMHRNCLRGFCGAHGIPVPKVEGMENG